MSDYLYKWDGTRIEVGGGGEYSGIVDFDKLAFGTAYSQKWKPFCIHRLSWGWYGRIIEVSAGDTIYFNFDPSTSADGLGHKSIEVFDSYPDDVTEWAHTAAIATGSHRLAQVEWTSEYGYSYTVPAELTSAKSVFIAAYNGSYEQYAKDTNYSCGRGSGKCISKYPFTEYPAYYADMNADSFDFDENKSYMFYQGLTKSINRMIGASVLYLGDSITDISAVEGLAAYNSGFGTGVKGKWFGGYGWASRIGRKYNQQMTVYGRSSARWWTQPTGGSTEYSCCVDVENIVNSNLNADEYQYIVIEYGTNDVWFRPNGFGDYSDTASNAVSASTVSAVRYCIEQLQSKFPSAAIIVVFPPATLASVQTNLANYKTLIDKVLDDYGVKRCYPRQNAGITPPMMRSDGIHLDYSNTEADPKTDKQHENNTEAVARFSRCLEAAMLEA